MQLALVNTSGKSSEFIFSPSKFLQNCLRTSGCRTSPNTPRPTNPLSGRVLQCCKTFTREYRWRGVNLFICTRCRQISNCQLTGWIGGCSAVQSMVYMMMSVYCWLNWWAVTKPLNADSLTIDSKISPKWNTSSSSHRVEPPVGFGQGGGSSIHFQFRCDPHPTKSPPHTLTNQPSTLVGGLQNYSWSRKFRYRLQRQDVKGEADTPLYRIDSPFIQESELGTGAAKLGLHVPVQ